MKLQWERDKLRLRLASEEMNTLLAGASLTMRSQFGAAFELTCHVRLSETPLPGLTGNAAEWQLSLPRAEVARLATRLPARDGLRWQLGALELSFDVDLRAKRSSRSDQNGR